MRYRRHRALAGLLALALLVAGPAPNVAAAESECRKPEPPSCRLSLPPGDRAEIEACAGEVKRYMSEMLDFSVCKQKQLWDKEAAPPPGNEDVIEL